MIDLQLEGKAAIVTGANRGLGRAIAEALVEQGTLVLATARRVEDMTDLRDAHPNRVWPVSCDVRDLELVQTLPALAHERFGRLDIVVNNAGIAPAGRFLEQSLDVWQDVLTVNVSAPAALARAAGQQFIRQRSGKVINIASTSGLLGKATLVAYSASKGALLQFTKALAAEWAPFGIQVNAIAPGAFETDAQREVLESPELLARRLRKIPAGRMGDAAEMGSLACWLASPLSDFVTGSVYVIDGGESSKL